LGPKRIFPVFSLRGRENVVTLGAPFWRANSVIIDPANGVYDRGDRNV
jgi:hypothetical protein